MNKRRHAGAPTEETYLNTSRKGKLPLGSTRSRFHHIVCSETGLRFGALLLHAGNASPTASGRHLGMSLDISLRKKMRQSPCVHTSCVYPLTDAQAVSLFP